MDANSVMRVFFKTNLRDERPFTVVGVVADTRALGMDVPIRPFVYFPFDQVPQFNIGIVVRAPKMGSASLGAMREAIAAVDPTQPLYGAVPLQQLVDTSLGSRRFTLLLLSLFAVLGLDGCCGARRQLAPRASSRGVAALQRPSRRLRRQLVRPGAH